MSTREMILERLKKGADTPLGEPTKTSKTLSVVFEGSPPHISGPKKRQEIPLESGEEMGDLDLGSIPENAPKNREETSKHHLSLPSISTEPEMVGPEYPSGEEGKAGRTPPGPPSSPETIMYRYSRRKRIKFLGRHSRDVLEGEIIALLPPAPDGTPWYQVRTRNQIVCVSQNHIVEKSHENGH